MVSDKYLSIVPILIYLVFRMVAIKCAWKKSTNYTESRVMMRKRSRVVKLRKRLVQQLIRRPPKMLILSQVLIMVSTQWPLSMVVLLAMSKMVALLSAPSVLLLLLPPLSSRKNPRRISNSTSMSSPLILLRMQSSRMCLI